MAAEAGGSIRTVARPSTLLALVEVEGTEAAAVAATSVIRLGARETATEGEAVAEAVETTQIMITKVVMLNFLLDQFQEQQMKMMFVLYSRTMGMFLKLL